MKLSFIKRAAHTLLFITEAKTFRVDADRKGILVSELEIIERGCDDPAKLAKTLQKIGEETTPLGRKIWLLCLSLPAHLLSLPSMQVQGVDDEMLTQALQFELEGVTGQSSQDSQIAYKFLKSADEMNDYWVTQIDHLMLSDTLKVLKKSKSTLAGLLNPGGLPLAMSDPAATEWLRLEAWSHQLYALQQTEDYLSLQVFSFDNPHWHGELEQWLNALEDMPASETLLNNKLEVLPETGRQFRLNEEHDLSLWLSLWAQTLVGQKNPLVPLIKPASNFNPNIAWMAGTGGGALLLCLLHAGWFIHQSNYYQTEADALTQVDTSMKALRKQINDSRDQKDKLEQKLNQLSGDADLIPNSLKSLQQRPARLLLALANGRENELVIETIENRKNELVITGVTLLPHLANQLATYLQDNLPEMNWHVQVPTKKDMELFDEGGPWSFELTLIDEGIAGFSEGEKK